MKAEHPYPKYHDDTLRFLGEANRHDSRPMIAAEPLLPMYLRRSAPLVYIQDPSELGT